MIEFKDVEIRYGDFVAMKDLNLHIKAGEFFTFLGPSGCGKTTTLRALVGFIKPTKGDIHVGEESIVDLPVEKRHIGMVFQSYALFPTMNVFENIAFGLRVVHMPKEQVRQEVLEVAKKIDLTEDQLKKSVADLSGGQQQRVALARAIILKPKILCLDEPLSNLDAKLRVGLRQELKQLQRNLGITTLYVTHDQEEALTLSDRIAVFNNGTIEQIGTPYEIYNNSASEFVCDFIGDINRIAPETMAELAQRTTHPLKNDRKGFIRIERIFSSPHPGYIEVTATVREREYNGMYTKYTYQIFDQQIKNIEKNDGEQTFDMNQVVSLYINPADIMQF